MLYICGANYFVLKKNNLPVRVAKKRERKNLLRKQKKYNSDIYSIFCKIFNNQLKNDEKTIRRNRFKLYEFLCEIGFIEYEDKIYEEIFIPTTFSIERNNNDTYRCFSKIVYSVMGLGGKSLTLNFERCEKTDEETMFFLNILLLELIQYFEKINDKCIVKNKKIEIKYKKPKNKDVNKILLLYRGKIDIDDQDQDEIPYDNLGYLKGEKSKKHYLENKKNVFTTKIVDYLESCLNKSGFGFKAEGRNQIEGIIGEILNNAEDHSPFNEYYVTSTFSMKNTQAEKREDFIGVLNMNFLNFGYSFYEGISEKNERNKDKFDLEYKFQSKKYKGFTKDNMFTLWALQEGVSRLKYEDESRGTGTIKFINGFLYIGDYSEKGCYPYLKIISGNTILICDNVYRPFAKENNGSSVFLVSLNKNNNLDEPPDSKNLKHMGKKFPGTMLAVKIYINGKHLSEKIKSNE